MNFITKKGLEEKLDKLDNGIDKFIVAGIYYGLNRSNYREQLLNIKTSSVNLEESTLTLSNGEKVVMDDLLREVTREAVEQKIYVKMAPGYVLDSINMVSSKNGKYTNKKIKNGSTVNLTSCDQISVSYHTTKKPVNYKAPSKWFGQVESPLHNYNSLIFQ